jgi:hypothetical protein
VNSDSLSWFVQNFRKRVLFSLRNPRYALGSLYRELTLADERFISTITGVSARRLREFLGEPIHTPEFAARLREVSATFGEMKIYSADLYAKKILLQYITIRALRPKIVVETGVANGVSSAYILLALQKNQRGALYSIGLNDPQYLPTGKPLGWIVPESLKSRWHLLIGDSSALLPSLLSKLRTIDLFIHDSLHTYDHMLWEYRTAFPLSRAGWIAVLRRCGMEFCVLRILP